MSIFFHFKSLELIDSQHIKILIQFPGNSTLKFRFNFLICVGGSYACFTLQILQSWWYDFIFLKYRPIIRLPFEDTWPVMTPWSTSFELKCRIWNAHNFKSLGAGIWNRLSRMPQLTPSWFLSLSPHSDAFRIIDIMPEAMAENPRNEDIST